VFRREREAKTGLVEIDARVVVGTDGLGYTDHRSYARKVRESLRAWNPNLAWPPKDLRNCLITFAEDCGLQLNLFEQYIGHAAKTVSDMSYKPRRLATFTRAERERQDHALDIYRRLVIDPVEAGLRGQRPRMVLQLSCNSTDSAAISGVPLAGGGGLILQDLQLVGTVGLEPTTPCSQSRCASQLRHVPKTRRLRGDDAKPSFLWSDGSRCQAPPAEPPK
jgi:hypothetical protein